MGVEKFMKDGSVLMDLAALLGTAGGTSIARGAIGAAAPSLLPRLERAGAQLVPARFRRGPLPALPAPAPRPSLQRAVTEAVAPLPFKHASLESILPAVAGPALGGYAGRALGARYKAPELGGVLGAITGGTAGQLLRERAEAARTPPGAPYALDATAADIPPWALQGAQLLQPAMKQAAHHEREPMSDVLLGEVPGAPVAQAAWNHGLGGAARTFGGMALGGLAGGGVGGLAGLGIEKLLGHQVNVPGVGMSLPDLLASVGGTIGSTKGLRYMKA